jgi:tetratricopeptide (TPR) repeat protein
MIRHLRYVVLGLCVGLGAPASAQMSFEGLDLGGGKKKKAPAPAKKKPSTKEKKDEKEKDEEAAPSGGFGGLDLSGGDAKPVEAPKATGTASGTKKGAQPTMSFDAIDVSGKTADRQKLDVAVNLFKDESYDRAALAAYELMQDPKMAGLHLEAHYLMAKALYRMGLYHSSLVEFGKILEKGPQTPFFATSLEWLFFISRKTVNEAVVLETIARYSNHEFPERFRNEFRYLLARYHFVRGRALDEVGQTQEAAKSFDEVKRLVLQIPQTDLFHSRAKYLEGLAYYREQKFDQSVEALKQVVRLTRVAAGQNAADRKMSAQLRELAFMQLARTHYEHRQNRYAVHYLKRIERGTSQWLEALFEASWANYRVGEYEQALGNLITLSSPFFREEYFPEAMILKAVIYYENCRYRESTMIVEDFERLYGPVQEELAAMLARDMDSAEYYNVLAEVQRKNQKGGAKSSTDLILERVLRLALTDKDLKKTNDSILELESELEGFNKQSDAFRFSNLVKALDEDLKVQRTALISKAGIMAKGKLQYERGELERLLADGLRIRFMTTEQEKEFLQAQLEQGGKKDIVKNIQHKVAVADTELYWPFVGEYWRDELGTYQYTLTKGCIDRSGSGRQMAEGSGGR